MRRFASEEVRHLFALERLFAKEQPVLERHEGDDEDAHLLFRRVLRPHYST